MDGEKVEEMDGAMMAEKVDSADDEDEDSEDSAQVGMDITMDSAEDDEDEAHDGVADGTHGSEAATELARVQADSTDGVQLEADQLLTSSVTDPEDEDELEEAGADQLAEDQVVDGAADQWADGTVEAELDSELAEDSATVSVLDWRSDGRDERIPYEYEVGTSRVEKV